jgi:hypothetical protein
MEILLKESEIKKENYSELERVVQLLIDRADCSPDDVDHVISIDQRFSHDNKTTYLAFNIKEAGVIV